MNYPPACSGRVYLFEQFFNPEEGEAARGHRLELAQEICSGCPLSELAKCKKLKNDLKTSRGVWYGEISTPEPKRRRKRR